MSFPAAFIVFGPEIWPFSSLDGVRLSRAYPERSHADSEHAICRLMSVHWAWMTYEVTL